MQNQLIKIQNDTRKIKETMTCSHNGQDRADFGHQMPS